MGGVRARPTGRPREEAPSGYVTTREAADEIGVTTETIRKRVKKGDLPGKQLRRPGTDEVRYYVEESALVGESETDESAEGNIAMVLEAKDETIAAKEELIAELRQRVAFLEHQVEKKLETLLATTLER